MGPQTTEVVAFAIGGALGLTGVLAPIAFWHRQRAYDRWAAYTDERAARRTDTYIDLMKAAWQDQSTFRILAHVFTLDDPTTMSPDLINLGAWEDVYGRVAAFGNDDVADAVDAFISQLKATGEVALPLVRAAAATGTKPTPDELAALQDHVNQVSAGFYLLRDLVRLDLQSPPPASAPKLNQPSKLAALATFLRR